MICYNICPQVGYGQVVGDYLNIGLLILNTLKEEKLQEGNATGFYRCDWNLVSFATVCSCDILSSDLHDI